MFPTVLNFPILDNQGVSYDFQKMSQKSKFLAVWKKFARKTSHQNPALNPASFWLDNRLDCCWNLKKKEVGLCLQSGQNPAGLWRGLSCSDFGRSFWSLFARTRSHPMILRIMNRFYSRFVTLLSLDFQKRNLGSIFEIYSNIVLVYNLPYHWNYQ